MKRFIYLIIFLVVLLTLKAFYLDPYLKERFKDENLTEANATVESVQEVQEPKPSVESTPAPHVDAEPIKEKMPLDKLGDSIAESIGDKIESKK